MSRIKIFMCCHKQYDKVPPLCEPILCGAAFNAPIPNAIPDNSGENISAKNHEYCELTAHYYAWKNITADYYGFCHYRRFFCADDISKHPYLTFSDLTSKQYQRLLKDEAFWKELIPKYDLIVPKKEDMGISAKQHYVTSKYHYADDLELFLAILNQKYPSLTETAKEYLSQNCQYFCNMFIMRSELFHEYCDILFSVLNEFDRRKSIHGDFQSDRTDGYLGEIFTGIYITHCYKNSRKIKELPRIDIGASFKKRAGCILLPPESKRRFMAKRIIKKLRGN